MVSAPIELAILASRRDVVVAARSATETHVPAATGSNSRSDVASLVAQAVAACGGFARDVRRIVLDRGPGSYTGLRSALAFARTLAAFQPIELGTVTSLEWIALAAWRVHALGRDRGTVAVVLDARRGHHHFAILDCTQTATSLKAAPVARLADTTAQSIAGCDLVVAESSLHQALAEACAERSVALVDLPAADPHWLFDPALAIEWADELAREPLYLLPTYADDVAPPSA